MPRPEDRFPATDRKVLRRLDESAIRQVFLGILATLFSFVAIVWIGNLDDRYPKLTVVIGGLVLAVGVLQCVLIFGFESMYPRGPQRWRRRLSFTLLLRAAVWSAFLVALLYTRGSGELFFLATFVPLTLGAALAATWLADIWTVRLYLGISIVPPLVGLLVEREAGSVFVATFLGIYLYALVRVSGHHFHLFWRVLARRENNDGIPAPVAGSVHARLLVRAAEELRQPVATVSDVLTLVESGRHEPHMPGVASRAAQQLVDRIEVLEYSARLLRGECVPQPVAGSLRRRCEEAVDDIGVVAAEAGVLCTAAYDADLPERLRTDYGLLFRALRGMAVWALERMPPGGELVLRFQVAAGQHEDSLRCAIDVHSLYLPESLRSGLDRTAQGSGIADPDVPLPLAVVGEIGRLLGGRLALVGEGEHAALALEVRLDVVDQAAAADDALQTALRGRQVLLAGLTPAVADALDVEFRALGMTLHRCALADIGTTLAAQEMLVVLADGRDVEALAAQVRALRDVRRATSARLVALSPGAEPPALPDDVARRIPDWLRLPLGRRRLRQYLSRVVGIGDGNGGGERAATPAPLRVLVVEDNGVNQIVARGMLEKLGCDVEIVADGALAVERVMRGGLDLVLMDIEMPGMSGTEATRRLREYEGERNLPRLPIVAMTAHTGDSEVAGVLAVGMDDVIAKPVSLASLASHIERFRARR